MDETIYHCVNRPVKVNMAATAVTGPGYLLCWLGRTIVMCTKAMTLDLYLEISGSPPPSKGFVQLRLSPHRRWQYPFFCSVLGTETRSIYEGYRRRPTHPIDYNRFHRVSVMVSADLPEKIAQHAALLFLSKRRKAPSEPPERSAQRQCGLSLIVITAAILLIHV